MIWPQATLIKKKDLADAKSVWKLRHENRPGAPNASLVEALKSGALAGRNIHIVIDTEWLTDADRKRGNDLAQDLQKTSLNWANKNLEFWLDYTDLPREAYIFDFGLENDKISFTGVYFTLPKDTDSGGFQYCYKTTFKAVTMSRVQFESLKRAVKLVYEGQLAQLKDKAGELISIERFGAKVLKKPKILAQL